MVSPSIPLAQKSMNLLQEELLNIRPLRESNCEIIEQQNKSGECSYIIKNKKNDTYIKLGKDSLKFFCLINGETPISDIVIKLFGSEKEIDWNHIWEFLSLLHSKKMIFPRSSEDKVIFEKIFAKPKKTPVRFFNKIGNRFIKTRIAFNDADKYVTRLYNVLGRFFFKKILIFGIFLISLIGLILFATCLKVTHLSIRDLLTVKGSYLLGIPVIYLGALVVMSMHECGHALTCKHFGRKVQAMGFMFYYGFPCFFTDVTDAWMLPNRKQIVVDGAGVIVNTFIGAIFSIIAFSFSSTAIQSICLKAALLNFLAVALNLVPFLKYDGYYIISDFLERPNLREEAFSLLLNFDCWKNALKGRFSCGEKKGIFIFGLCSFIYGVVTLSFALNVVLSLIYKNLSHPYNVYVAYVLISIIGLSLISSVRGRIKSNLGQYRRSRKLDSID